MVATDVKKGFIHGHAAGFAGRQNMKNVCKTSIDYYFLPNKIFCGMVGMWPIEDKSSTCRKLFAYFRLIVGFVAVCSVFVPEIMLVASNYSDVKLLAGKLEHSINLILFQTILSLIFSYVTIYSLLESEVGCVLVTVGQLLFRMIYLIARKERAFKLYYEIRNLWDSSDDPIKRQPYEELAYYARICTIIFYSSCMCNVTTFSIAAAIDYFKISYNASDAYENRHLPVEVWYGVDISPSPYFEIFFVCQVLMISICAAAVSGLDGSFMTVIMHVSGQFKLIGVWINHIGIKINCKSSYLPKLETELIRCIRHHQRVINVVNDVNNLLTPIVFVQLLTSGIEICLSGFALVSYNAGTDKLRFISYFTSLGIQLLLLCWPGEILIQESQAVGHIAYFNVPWYSLPHISQKQFCLLIIRAQQHCNISALTFNTLSIRTLTTVFNTAVSFFTLLRKTQQI